jgi:hypothetical protein
MVELAILNGQMTPGYRSRLSPRDAGAAWALGQAASPVLKFSTQLNLVYYNLHIYVILVVAWLEF